MENNPTIHISMLGNFSVQLGNTMLTDNINRSKKPWNLLEYMIFFRNRRLTAIELIELNWSEDTSDNPVGALKTLMFRVRKLFTDQNFKEQFIVQQQGSYAWNPLFHTSLDIDIFHCLYTQIFSNTLDNNQILESCKKAISLYKGDFLPKFSLEPWVIPIQSFYHNCYIKIVYEAIRLLEITEDYNEISTLCQLALQIEPYDEYLNYQLIMAFFKTNQKKSALKHYKFTADLFFNEFAITPSKSLKALYKTIVESDREVELDFQTIANQLESNNNAIGAYYCDYELFKELYQISNRTIARTGESIFLCLLTLTTVTSEIPDVKILVKTMEALKHAIQHSLRRGDIFSRCSVSQYMIILPTANYDNSDKIMKRIIHKFHLEYFKKDLLLTYKFDLVKP